MKIVNLYGGPHSGKTTTAAGLFYKMKLRHMKVKLVHEFAEELVYDNRLEYLLDQQELIFAEQNHRQHVLRGKVDWAVTDSPLGLSLVYPRINVAQRGVTPWPALEEFEAFVLKSINTYNNINIFLERPECSFQNHGRAHNLEESILLDEAIKKMLNATCLKWHIYKADEHAVDKILEEFVLNE